MEVEDKKGKRVSIFLIRYPIYKSEKIPRPALLVIPGVIQKKSKLNVTHYIYYNNMKHLLKILIFIIFFIFLKNNPKNYDKKKKKYRVY